MITKTELEELKQLASAATLGPWRYDHGNRQVEKTDGRDGICGLDNASRDRVNGEINIDHQVEDGEFIAAANPETILTLVDTIYKLVETVEGYLKCTEINSEEFEKIRIVSTLVHDLDTQGIVARDTLTEMGWNK